MIRARTWPAGCTATRSRASERRGAGPVSAAGAAGGAGLRAVAVNMLGVVEHPLLGDTPYRVDADGHPYLPVGDGGLVLGVRLGDPVSALAGDHVAPGACLVHPDPAARLALVSYACLGNEVEVRTGRAGGAAEVPGAAAGESQMPGADGLLLGDLVAVTDLDARHNMGYRRGWLTVGVVVHGTSPLPGHGPGITPLLTSPLSVLSPAADATDHTGLTESGLGLQ